MGVAVAAGTDEWGSPAPTAPAPHTGSLKCSLRPATASPSFRISTMWHDESMEERSASRDHSLDAATVELGRRHIERIRAQLNPLHQPDPTASTDDPPVTAPSASVVEHPESMSVERITAEMATAAERERLEARIVQLETEVRQLRNALATILDAAATGIAAPNPTNHSPLASAEVRAPDNSDQHVPADLPSHRSGG